MKEREVVELYINGKLYKTFKINKYEEVVKAIGLNLKVYEKASEDVDTIVYCDIKNYKVAVIQSKIYIGYKDSEGNKIYLHDVLKYGDIQDDLHGTYPFEGYYIRYMYPADEGYAWGRTVDYKFRNQDDFNATLKVEDCSDFDNSCKVFYLVI